MTELTATIDRVFAIDRPTMWSLWTDPQHASRWMRPSVAGYTETNAVIDARPGGAYRFEMHPAEGQYAVGGTYLAVEPVERLRFTWQWEGDPEETVVDVTFEDAPDGTRVRVVHSRFDSIESSERHTDGWNGCLDSLSQIFEDARR